MVGAPGGALVRVRKLLVTPRIKHGDGLVEQLARMLNGANALV
jgi:hypothetical protein